MSFDPASPVHANTVVELRDLEQQVRAKLLASANGAEPVRKDWKAAVEAVTGGVLTVKWKSFTNLDSAMRFAADKTGISAPETLGAALSVALVKTPVMLSFRRVASSSYASTHIVTVFGVSIPPATMSDSAHPRLLLVNSAIKYAGGIKNICASSDLSDSDRYRAAAMLTSDYDMTNFGASAPYLVTWIEAVTN